MLGVEVDGPIVERPGLETAENSVRVVVLCFILGDERRRRVGVEGESADGLFDASRAVAITEMKRVVLVEPVVAFDRVLDFSVLGPGINIAITERDRVGPRAARE